MLDSSDCMLNGHSQGLEVGIFSVLHAIIGLSICELLFFLYLALTQFLSLLDSASGQLHKHLFIEHFSLLGYVVLNGLIRVICKFFRGTRSIKMLEVMGTSKLTS